MNSTTIIYIIISFLSLILGVKEKKIEEFEKAIKATREAIQEQTLIEKEQKNVQQNETAEKNATNVRP